MNPQTTEKSIGNSNSVEINWRKITKIPEGETKFYQKLHKYAYLLDKIENVKIEPLKTQDEYMPSTLELNDFAPLNTIHIFDPNCTHHCFRNLTFTFAALPLGDVFNFDICFCPRRLLVICKCCFLILLSCSIRSFLISNGIIGSFRCIIQDNL